MYPLKGRRNDGQDALVSSCHLSLVVNPSTGVIDASTQQGEAIVDRKQTVWTYIQIFGFFLLICALFSAYSLYSRYDNHRRRQLHLEWLTNFYKHNAPEVRNHM